MIVEKEKIIKLSRKNRFSKKLTPSLNSKVIQTILSILKRSFLYK